MAKVDPNTPATVGYVHEAVETILVTIGILHKEVMNSIHEENSKTRDQLRFEIAQTRKDLHEEIAQTKEDIMATLIRHD